MPVFLGDLWFPSRDTTNTSPSLGGNNEAVEVPTVPSSIAGTFGQASDLDPILRRNSGPQLSVLSLCRQFDRIASPQSRPSRQTMPTLALVPRG